MEYPVQVAFCPLLFAQNGGQFTKSGKPIFTGEDIRGLCDKAFDCNDCFIMQSWLEGLKNAGWDYGWECLKCLSDTKDIPRQIPGYFQEGGVDVEPETLERPSVPGCTRCNWATSFLQLVLRKI